MHPPDCPPWEYRDHPNCDQVLPQKSKEALITLRNSEADLTLISKDARQFHSALFSPLTPKNYEYYAGNHRGDGFRCLEYSSVHVPADPRVGAAPELVEQEMRRLRCRIDEIVAALDAASQTPNAQIPKTQKVLYIIAAISSIFVEFLRIHPHVNGNGHIARLMVIALLGRYRL